MFARCLPIFWQYVGNMLMICLQHVWRYVTYFTIWSSLGALFASRSEPICIRGPAWASARALAGPGFKMTKNHLQGYFFFKMRQCRKSILFRNKVKLTRKNSFSRENKQGHIGITSRTIQKPKQLVIRDAHVSMGDDFLESK